MIKKSLFIILLFICVFKASAIPFNAEIYTGNESLNGIMSGELFNVSVSNMANMTIIVRIDTNASFIENKSTPLSFTLPSYQKLNVTFKAPITDRRVLLIYVNVSFYKVKPLYKKKLYSIEKTYYVIPRKVFSSYIAEKNKLIEKIEKLNKTILEYKKKLNESDKRIRQLEDNYIKLQNKYMNTVNQIQYFQNLYNEASKKLNQKLEENSNLQLLVISIILAAIGVTFMALKQKPKKEEILGGNEPLT